LVPPFFLVGRKGGRLRHRPPSEAPHVRYRHNMHLSVNAKVQLIEYVKIDR
jgi:hypothetical protein